MSQGQLRFVPGTFLGSSQEQPDQKVYVYVPFSCQRKWNFGSLSGTKKRGFLEGSFCNNLCLSWLWRSECEIDCWARYPWVLFVSLAVTVDSAETPFALQFQESRLLIQGGYGLQGIAAISDHCDFSEIASGLDLKSL